MDQIIFDFLAGLLGGVLAGLTVLLRTRHPSPKTTSMPAILEPLPASPVPHRKISPSSENGQRIGTLARSRRRAGMKTLDPAVEPSPAHHTASATAVSFETCPSCGLQAPMSLLAEHYLGSPSHRNRPPATASADKVGVEASKQVKEDDSEQSVRNLLQILVPPRAFGRRHAHRSVDPLSRVVMSLPTHRRYP